MALYDVAGALSQANGNTWDISTDVTPRAGNIGGIGGKQRCIDDGGGERRAEGPAVRAPRRRARRGRGRRPPQAPRAETPTGAAPGQMSPEMRARIGELRNRVRLNLGQIVLAMMNLPRYRHQALADLTHNVLDPMMRDRMAIARRGVEGQAPDEEDVAGIAIWASVSEAVDAKITEQMKAGVFPLRLASEDWAGGDTVWLLDVIAGDRKAATAVLANFRQLSGERDIKIHPIVARLVDKDVLEKMKARAVGAASAAGEAKMSEPRGNA